MITREIVPLGSFDVLTAYRADLARCNRASLGDEDSAWLRIGTLIAHAAESNALRRQELLTVVRGKLRAVLGERRWKRGCLLDPASPSSDDDLAPRIRAFCWIVEDVDGIGFAEATTRAFLLCDSNLGELEHGRFEAELARFDWKSGRFDSAESHYLALAQRAVEIASTELETRASVGLSILARMRGNLPAWLQHAEHAVRVAEEGGLSGLGRAEAHQTLMAAHGTLGQLDAAIVDAWSALLFADSDNEESKALQVINISQLFHELGHYETAAAGFSFALRLELPKRSKLPALGGAATTAARRGQPGEARRLIAAATELLGEQEYSYVGAACLLELAEACVLIDDPEGAAYFRNRALEIAAMRGYHQLAYRAEPAARIARPLRARPLPLSLKAA